jgi:hypothetical protein
MTKFNKAAVAGFIFGTALSLTLANLKIKRRPWMMDLRKGEELTKKETMVWLNSQAEDLEILSAFVTMTGVADADVFVTRYLDLIRLKAMTDPVFEALLTNLQNHNSSE